MSTQPPPPPSLSVLPRSCPALLADVSAEAWEGGGFLGHAYGPIIEALDGWQVKVTKHAGTSAGAITALLRALGKTTTAIRHLQELTPWDQFARYRPPALLRLFATGGWHSIDYPRAWIVSQLLAAGGGPSLTFSGLRKLTGHDLIVATTRYELCGEGPISAEPFVFSPDLTPGAPVAEAVLASMAVPLFWPPVEVDGWHFCDGGVAMNHPLSVFDHMDPRQVLGVRLASEQLVAAEDGEAPPKPARPNVGGILLANTEMLRTIANREYVPHDLWPRIVRIDCGRESALDFRARPDRIIRLRKAGIAGLKSWLAKGEQ